ncbi:YggT family protein [Marchantia polymorpha subsp. ruderalis]|uniref:YGGT family protein n=2 Tax=Marchantia polymorpha TaxID=3197 RepID=A0A176W6B5_MARPO|nr:hypothetical protein AXG93_4492s1440 [Marchantia polymorpha subsp. ruderalis]PTQ38645.1 hypothetical protein MARPO_0050s0098 [Marchantia polymorpha]BBN05432.1 hypothetical protein Mp_3g13060 [Marchantia polymorpha subsp. ruderalis]|eukprot:PTQ38645.1 hypothetical protein MARPO_0050s0098 [Marchantia polymorpha]
MAGPAESSGREITVHGNLLHIENPLQIALNQLRDHVQARFLRTNVDWQVGGWRRRERLQSGRIALRGGKFAAIIPGDSVAEVVITSGIFSFLNIYNTLLITRLVLTWFPNPPAIIANPLSTICDPYLNIFRGIIPPLGGSIDLSPILAFLALNVFTNTAAALPAELPSNGAIAQNPSLSKMTWRQRAQLRKGKQIKEDK